MLKKQSCHCSQWDQLDWAHDGQGRKLKPPWRHPPLKCLGGNNNTCTKKVSLNGEILRKLLPNYYLPLSKKAADKYETHIDLADWTDHKLCFGGKKHRPLALQKQRNQKQKESNLALMIR